MRIGWLSSVFYTYFHGYYSYIWPSLLATQKCSFIKAVVISSLMLRRQLPIEIPLFRNPTSKSNINIKIKYDYVGTILCLGLSSHSLFVCMPIKQLKVVSPHRSKTLLLHGASSLHNSIDGNTVCEESYIYYILWYNITYVFCCRSIRLDRHITLV